MQRLRIGFHGIPNAGKTALQAVLRLMFARKVGGARVRLFFDDEATNEYLAGCEKGLAEHRTLRANTQGRPDVLRWKLEVNKDVWQVESIDFAGALVEAGVAAEVQHLSQEVKEFLGGCDALLLLMDATDPDLRQLNALNLLKNYLRECRTHHGSDRRLLALLWTKVDRLGPLDDPAAVMDRVKERLSGLPAFEDIAEFLAEDDDLFRQFGVSAYGGEGPDGQAPPLKEIKPYGILEILHWAATTSRGVIADDLSRRLGEARHRVSALRHSRPRWLPPDTGALLRTYDELLPEHQVDDPYIRAEVQADRAAIDRLKRRWRRRAAELGLAALAAALACGYFYGQAQAIAAYDRSTAFALTHADVADAAQRRAQGEALLDSGWLRRFWIGSERRQALQERLEADRQAEEQYDFEQVVAQRAALAGEDKAAERIKLVQAAAFRTGRYKAQYDEHVTKDTEVDYWYRERQEREAIVAAAALSAPTLQARDLYRRCERYAEQFPRRKEPEAIGRAQETARRNWEDALWGAAVKAEQGRPEGFSANRELYRAVLEVPGVNRDRVTSAIGSIEENWDRHSYEQAYTAARGMSDWAGLTATRDRCREYRAASRGVKTMLAPVREFLDWTEDVARGKVTCSLVIPKGSIDIPSKSDLNPWFNGLGRNTILVYVDLNGGHWSVDAGLIRALYSSRLEAEGFPIVWADNQEMLLTLRLKNDAKVTSTARISLGDMCKLKGEANGTLKEAKGVEVPVSVEWACPDMDLARHRLPPYAGPAPRSRRVLDVRPGVRSREPLAEEK